MLKHTANWNVSQHIISRFIAVCFPPAQIILFFSISSLSANDKVAYLDIDYILNNTIVGKLTLNSLKKDEEINKYLKIKAKPSYFIDVKDDPTSLLLSKERFQQRKVTLL